MSLLKYNSHSINALADHFFKGSIADFVGSDFVQSQPTVNVIETDKAFRLELAAPGLEKGDFHLNIEKNHLKISVKKEQEEMAEGEKFTRREFAYTSFERSFKLSDKVDQEAISASYEQGILNIHVPKKAAEIIQRRNIEIS